MKIKKIYNPKSLKQLARDNIKLDEKQLSEELAKKMTNPYYFTDRALSVGFIITLENQHINHGNSNFFIKPNYFEFVIEVRYVGKVLENLPVVKVRKISQFIFKGQTIFSARFDK